MKRIIVTGANGFLGSMIIRKALEAKKMDIVAVTSRPQSIEKITREECYVIKTEEFLRKGFQFSQEDIVINCLFPTNADGYKMADGLKKVFEIMSTAKECGADAFINISSQSVYASQRSRSATEKDVLSLETGYAVGKYCSEMFCDQMFYGRPHTNIRMASLLGIGYEQRIINRMVEQALEGKELVVVGGMQRYGFLDVRDAASGIVKMAMSDPAYWKTKYNLGRMESYTLIEIANNIIEQLKIRGIESGYIIKEGMDARNSSINPERFMNDFGWKPEISLSQTIADIVESKMNGVEKQNL